MSEEEVKPVSGKIPLELHNRAKIEAVKEGITFIKLMTNALEEYLDRREKKRK